MDDLKLDYATPPVLPGASALHLLARWTQIIGIVMISWALVEIGGIVYVSHLFPIQTRRNDFLPAYIGLTIWILVGVLDCLSASFMRRKTHRGFSIVVAIFNWLIIPFGTPVGIWAFVVLVRKSGDDAYAKSDPAM